MPSRLPNLWHLLLFFALTLASLLAAEALLIALHPSHLFDVLQDQRLQTEVNAGAYLLVIPLAAAIFPLLWKRPFLTGIEWNAHGAQPVTLVPLGIALGFVFQGLSSLLPTPKEAPPIEKIFHVPGILWIMAFFGVVLAPVFEEIVFRGFLLPGIALIVDWMRLPRSLEALEAWRLAEGFSSVALIVSAMITSLLFGLLHAAQEGYSWPAVALLFVVSLALCWIRLRTKSVAASTLVHASYNFSIFLTLFIQTGGFRHLDKL